MISNIALNNVSSAYASKSVRISNDSTFRNIDLSVTAPDIQSDTIEKSVDTQFKELVDGYKSKLPTAKIAWYLKAIGFKEETKEDFIKLLNDKVICDEVLEYIKEHEDKDINNVFKNKKHVNALIDKVTKYSEENDYPDVNTFMKKRAFKNAIHAYFLLN